MQQTTIARLADIPRGVVLAVLAGAGWAVLVIARPVVAWATVRARWASQFLSHRPEES
jgi:hypothetical protein